MIEVQGLTKYYGTKLAIQNVNFRVEKGEILGFVGPNAAGKTTTMRIITGYMPASSGTAKVDGYDVLSHSLEVRKRIGYLPETVPLYPEMTVRGYLEFQANIKDIPSKRRKARIDEVVQVCGLVRVQRSQCGKLSKGFRQRVGLAQAILADPPVLILDEPTIGLDPGQRVDIRQFIKQLAGSHSIILSTHILPDVEMTCSRVLIINEGHIVASDTPENLTNRVRGSDQLELEIRGPASEIVRTIKAIPGVRDAQHLDGQRYKVDTNLGSDLREVLAATVVGKGWGLRRLQRSSMSLEDIFSRLVTKEA
ncbi:MAG: ABC transporter ATP-binding protein [Bacteroidetes bacterium]|nr:ABC transporter ATP-binding protein [Bacteroidota bacterium]MCL5027379.1 ABC transporter ATP-binding protein [Chloroflexota bacterium]